MIRPNFFTSAALAHMGAASHVQFALSDDFIFKMDQAKCAISIDKHLRAAGAGLSHATVFSADNTLLTVGHGDVDDYTVMTAGNIKTYPKKETSSLGMEDCTASHDEEKQAVVVKGKVRLADGEDTRSFNLRFTAQDDHKVKFHAHVKGLADDR